MRRITKEEIDNRNDLGYIGPDGCIGTDNEEIVLDTEDGTFLITRNELITRGMEVDGFMIRLPKDLNELIGKSYLEKEIDAVVEEFGISPDAAINICYLRTRSRWTQEKEDYLIRLAREYKPLPDMYDDFEVE